MRTIALLAAACLAGGTVEAQATVNGRPATAEEERRAATAVAGLRDGVMKRFMVSDSAAMNRPTIGVSLGGSAHKRDTLGVFVESVAEDGPAERAGIYEGHRIAFINNVDVRASAADAGDPYLSSVGSHRLVRAMRDVQVGSTVTLRVWTGSGYRDVQVRAARFADVFKNQRVGSSTFFYSPDAATGFGPSMEHLRTAPVERLRMIPSVHRRIERDLHPGEARKTEVRVAPARAASKVRRAHAMTAGAVTRTIQATPSRVRRFTI